MPQTLVISTPDAVSTTLRTFPKQGVYNLKITRNGEFDTVELWFRSGTANIILELAGASFLSTARVNSTRDVPTAPTNISGSTLALTQNAVHYMKIKLNNGIYAAHLRCSYTAKSAGSTVCGGNISGQAFVDYSKKPYISTNLEKMFILYPVKTDLTKWDVSSVDAFVGVFLNNMTFNQPIGNWNVSNVNNMGSMFQGATAFDQPIGNWNVSKVTNMGSMFNMAAAFNQPIGNWNVSSVINMPSMFSGATAFNQDLSSWNVSNVTNMDSMFHTATAFNQPIGNWNVSKVTNMGGMFRRATAFDQPIGNWDVSKVTHMAGMFYDATKFNQPIGNWNVSNVTNMGSMFQGATAFNQDLSGWAAKFNINVILEAFFANNTWSTVNYDKFLNALWTDIGTTRPQAWATRTVPRVLGMGYSKYSAASEAARASLIANGWTITDGGLSA